MKPLRMCMIRRYTFNPQVFISWYNRGLSLAKVGRYEDAIHSYDRVIELDQNNVEALYNRGLSLCQTWSIWKMQFILMIE